MIDFIVFLIFMAAGAVVASFFGWMLMRRLWSNGPIDKEKVGMWATLLAAVFTVAR